MADLMTIKGYLPFRFNMQTGNWEIEMDGLLAHFVFLDLDNTERLDEVITTLRGAAATIVNTPVTSAQSGLMTPDMLSKLDSVAYGATNYVHPTMHPASMIETDPDRRFLSDAQITQFTEATSGDASVRSLQESITHIAFQLALQGLIDTDGISNVIVDVIDSEDSVTIVSGQYADGSVFI